MPKQKPGRSKQDYGTPWAFIHAVEKRWGALDIDLAATEANAKAPIVITPELDTFTFNWRTLQGRRWLNPEFAEIEPWARKCWQETPPGSSTFMLVPASVGSLWFLLWVFEKARVFFLRPRLTFEGQADSYPKDLILCIYDAMQAPGFETWDWRQNVA